MNPTTLISSGVILLTVVAIASGGAFMLRVVTGAVPVNRLQHSFFRAGHAHAGVLVTLGLVVRLLLAQAPVPAWSAALADGVLYAAILMPTGFFLSVIGRDPQAPNAWRYAIWLGAASLTVGVVAAGIGLIIAGLG